jgi:AraC-like DNA-binding protein
VILAAVPADRLPRLRAAGVRRFAFRPVPGWAEAMEMIRREPIEMAVVDPRLSGTLRTREIERLRILFPSLPMMAYTALTADSAAALLTLGRAGIRRAIFHRFDDAPETLQRAMTAELEQSASWQVLSVLAPHLGSLPDSLRRAFEAALHDRWEAPTVSTVAAHARITRRTCERWFERLALPSPRVVLVAARLLYAHRLLLDPGYTIEDVAVKLGFGKVRTLQQHIRDIFGLTAGELRISLTAEEATAIVLERFFPEAREAAS